MAAKSRRLAGLHQVILPWPLDTLDEAEIRRIARSAYDDIVTALTVPGCGVVNVESDVDDNDGE